MGACVAGTAHHGSSSSMLRPAGLHTLQSAVPAANACKVLQFCPAYADTALQLSQHLARTSGSVP